MVYNSSTIIMKKLFYSVISLLIMGLTFASCEKPKTNEDDENKDNVENTDQNDDENKDDNQTVEPNCYLYSGQYSTDEFGSVYILEFLSNDLIIDGQSISGLGEDLMIMLYAQAQEDGYPKAKTYDVIPLLDITDEDTECVVGGYVYEGQPIGTFAYTIEDGEAVDGLLCIGGTIKFEGNATKGTMTANLEFESAMTGEIIEKQYIYSGALELQQVSASAPARAPKIK